MKKPNYPTVTATVIDEDTIRYGDSTFKRERVCHDITPNLSEGRPYPDTFTCSECGAREDGVVKEKGMYCYNCGARVECDE